jgi:predicted metal-binding membrane protein
MIAKTEDQFSRGVTFASLLATGATLICCAIPALLVALGAGAVLATAVSAVPQLVWLSEHKEETFIFAGLALTVAGIFQWRARSLPCPAEPGLARACWNTRRWSRGLYAISIGFFLVGAHFAFIAPLI